MADDIHSDHDDPVEPAPSTKSRWQIFGWVVIGLMVTLIVLNFFQLIEPEVNKVALPGIVVAYIVYIFLRSNWKKRR